MRGASSARPRSTRRWPARGCRVTAGAGRGARAGDVGADAALALPPRDLARGLPADRRARASRRSSPRWRPKPSWRCAARRCSPPSSPPRASSPPSEELLEALAPTAEREGIEPEQLLEQLRDAGRLEELREDLAARQAIELIAERAKPIPLEQAQAREKLWTPEKEAWRGGCASACRDRAGGDAS